MTLRGVKTAKAAKAAAKDRGSRGGRFNRRIQAKTDEPFIGRFRGLTEPPTRVWEEGELNKLDTDDLVEICSEIQAVFKEDMEKSELVDAILDRYKSLEPALNARHYVDRNKGRKGAFTYMNCGDSEAAVLGDIRTKTDCEICKARLSGDKGVGWPQTTNWFSFYDYRKVHRIPSGDEEKDEYVPCTMEEKGHCKQCSRNKKILDREGMDEGDLKFEDNDAFNEWCAKTGYARTYANGMRMFNLANKFADLVLDLSARISRHCRSCGTGKVKPTGACCPHCGEEYDWDELIEAGWNPEEMQNVECPECGEEGVPEPMYECSNCDDAKPARLCDVDVRCVMTGEGTSKNWTFTEQLPVRPLDYTDEEDAVILSTPLPDYDRELAPPSVEEQLKFIGKAPARGPTPSAPVVGGKKKKKGGKGGKGMFSKRG